MESKNWFNKKVEDVEKELKTNKEKGLTEEQVTEIRNQKGYHREFSFILRRLKNCTYRRRYIYA